jgi:hypothetical protein
MLHHTQIDDRHAFCMILTEDCAQSIPQSTFSNSKDSLAIVRWQNSEGNVVGKCLAHLQQLVDSIVMVDVRVRDPDPNEHIEGNPGSLAPILPNSGARNQIPRPACQGK